MSILSKTKSMKSNTFITDKHIYLQRLKTLALAPKIVYAIGDLPSESVKSVAIIGTRRPTVYGKKVSFEFAYKMASQGIIIISGLAYGIDAAAHKGAIAAGGRTIAVVAHGLDTLYPPAHKSLTQQIIQKGGGIISEYADGVPTMKHRFLERNRIVSGLADALVVIEAGEQSGTYSTVQYALEQGKEVFAIPGPIDSPASAGTNKLIQQGAHPALHPQDIVEVIAPGLIVLDDPPQGDTPAETQLLLLIYRGIANTQQILDLSALQQTIVMQSLTMLEIHGRIQRDAIGQWSFIR
jgi:DNA processing protein